MDGDTDLTPEMALYVKAFGRTVWPRAVERVTEMELAAPGGTLTSICVAVVRVTSAGLMPNMTPTEESIPRSEVEMVMMSPPEVRPSVTERELISGF